MRFGTHLYLQNQSIEVLHNFCDELNLQFYAVKNEYYQLEVVGNIIFHIFK